MKRNVFYPFIPVAQEIGNMVDDFVNKGLNDIFGGSVWQHNFPPVNIKEDDQKFILEMAAPGLEKKDFKIQLEHGLMTISVNKDQISEIKDDNYSKKEFSYQSFKRSFTLPEHADASKISAAYNNGVLNVQIEKKLVIKDEKTIEVQ